MKTNSALNALNSATASPQALEQAQNLSKFLEDLERLLNALQESHTDLLQGANSSQNPTQATNADALRPSPNTTAPEVKHLWKYGVFVS
ncbi:hypothetical protein [Helicobacter ailurogastricus]|uniref:Uncharacterized protein n=1 Tax=Helicobacter ailurogastricus TaxID=1578720 RepID=A0A0K2XH84_9HELI|nr:hypothetical protein [Helicobacter ailurogastricus]CRF40266.1 hypothetical protein HAL011_00180 [Helicobacter ailurogastricus]CRF43154.1 hypothetical protein HAL013_13780 [Helicobacter ailurogastricus]CRF44084.1 hypothetical protein HAL09_06530 [Helicobacter ailurogastricus]